MEYTGIQLCLKLKQEAAQVGVQIHCGTCSLLYMYDQFLGGMY